MVQTISGINRNIWRRSQPGQGSPQSLDLPLAYQSLYLPLWHPEMIPSAYVYVGSAIITGAPFSFTGVSAQTVTVTQAGNLKIVLASKFTGIAASGTATITGSPVTLVAGSNTIIAEGTGNFTITLDNLVVSKDLNAYILTVVGATKGPYGRTLDGTDDIITPADSSVMDFPLASFSIKVIFKPTTAALDNGLLDKRYASVGNKGYFLTIRPNIIFRIGNPSGTTRMTLVDDGTKTILNAYHHLIVSVDRPNNTGKLFLNGLDRGATVTIDGGFDSSTNCSSTDILKIGYALGEGTPYFKGIFSEIEFDNQLFTAVEAMNDFIKAKRGLPWL